MNRSLVLVVSHLDIVDFSTKILGFLVIESYHIRIYKMTNCVNGNGAFQSEGITHGRASVRCRHSFTLIQRLYQLRKFVDF